MRRDGAGFRAPGRIGGLLLLAWLGGCDGQDESGGGSGSSSLGSETSGASGAESTESSDGDCFEGELGCPCGPGGLCAPELVCVDGACEERGGGEVGTGGETSGADETGGGVDACVETVECFESEVCAFGTCVPVASFDWRFSVLEFVPGGCRDGWGSAEVFYRYYEDGAPGEQSPTVGCPAQWPKFDQVYSPGATFEIEFWELDAFFDDFFTRLCWPDSRDDGACAPVPDYVLHDGEFYGVSDDGAYTFELFFEPVL